MYDMAMQTYTGSCHCGNVRYEAETDISQAITCNCSHCGRKGLILTFVPEEKFKLLSGENDQTLYHFNKGVIDHLFCKTCGVESFGRGIAPDGTKTVALNIRCFEGIDVHDLKPQQYNGKDL